jgi:calcium-dependent protein kinase
VKNEPASLHYQVVKKLGEGSYGSVYKVLCKLTRQERAMKIIRKSDVTDEENVFAELEVLKQLDHPNILKLYEVFEEEDFFYVLTEFCEGGEVLKSLKKHKNLNEKTVAQLMRQLFGGLVYMHQRNIVHRDLKLENLLYESKGK